MIHFLDLMDKCMKAHHFFEAKVDNFGEYDFEPTFVSGLPQSYQSTFGTFYKHTFEYPDAFYHIYVDKVLTGSNKDKLYNELRRFAKIED